MHANNLSILATGYKQVCAWHLKKESISFQHFHYSYHLILTSSAHGRRIQLQREERYIYRERLLCFICPSKMRCTHVHNDRFWQQCQPQTILCHIYLSSVERCSDSGSRWWMRHHPASDTYFSFPEQTIRLKWILLAEGTQATQVTWQAWGNRSFVHKETPALIPHTH